ncbi:hypothetical protein GJ496_007369 [Pomphorhynchus laevis]|nr:hypothetical protein GJ496_007369 [Pomphorhynchus laevis]
MNICYLISSIFLLTKCYQCSVAITESKVITEHDEDFSNEISEEIDTVVKRQTLSPVSLSPAAIEIIQEIFKITREWFNSVLSILMGMSTTEVYDETSMNSTNDKGHETTDDNNTLNVIDKNKEVPDWENQRNDDNVLENGKVEDRGEDFVNNDQLEEEDSDIRQSLKKEIIKAVIMKSKAKDDKL